MNRDEIIQILKDYFQQKAVFFNINFAFLYGSWASGHPVQESDIDVAILSSEEMDKDRAFDIVSKVSVELTELLKRDTNVLYIDVELTKPMLLYNAIIQGIPVFIKDHKEYADLRLKAISMMEDFSLFGTRWQTEIAKKRLESLGHV